MPSETEKIKAFFKDLWDRIQNNFAEWSFLKGILTAIAITLVLTVTPAIIIWIAELVLIEFGIDIREIRILVITNGIVMALIYGIHYANKKGNFLRIITNILILIMLIYFFFVGYNVFTLFLPVSTFATVYLEFGETYFLFSYLWIAIFGLLVQFITICKAFIKFYFPETKTE